MTNAIRRLSEAEMLDVAGGTTVTVVASNTGNYIDTGSSCQVLGTGGTSTNSGPPPANGMGIRG